MFIPPPQKKKKNQTLEPPLKLYIVLFFLGGRYRNSKGLGNVSTLEKSCHNGTKRGQCVLEYKT